MRTWPAYRTLWVFLLLGWTVSAADRALTGPVVTWMIENDVGFLKAAAHPFALGGLIGGLFFAGYMLTQFPGGYLGDKYGHRTIITISLIWAGIATIISGVVAGLVDGANRLEVRVQGMPGQRDTLALVNHPVTGPMFSGPQQMPFVCTTIQGGVARQPLVDSSTAPGYRVTDVWLGLGLLGLAATRRRR